MEIKASNIPSDLNVRGKYFYKFISEYFSGNYKELREAMTERKHTVKDTDATYRVINHWDNSGVLPAGVESDGKWRKFSFAEIAWLRIINKCRNFGVSLESLKYANALVMAWEPYDSYPIFEYYLIHAWLTGTDSYVVLWEGGFSDVFDSREIEMIKMINGQSNHMLLISLKEIIKEMGLKNIKAPDMLFPLDKSELSLLDEIRSGGFNEITVKVNEKGKIENLREKTRVQGDKIESSVLLQKAKRESMYGSVTFNFQEGQEQVAEIIRNIKISNLPPDKLG